MISEERLKELIEQEKGCYRIGDFSGIGYIHLKQEYEPNIFENGKDNYLLYIYTNNEKKYKDEIWAEDLFETEADAKEFLKYGNITRTEKFPYVSWEDVCDGTNHHIVFTTPKHQKVEMIICDGYIDIICVYTAISEFSKPLTRENYHKALDICVKLFKRGGGRIMEAVKEGEEYADKT